MPKFLEDKLEASASAAGKKGKAKDRYVYGAMNTMGAMHGNKETAKGAAMEAKHEAKKNPEAARKKKQRADVIAMIKGGK